MQQPNSSPSRPPNSPVYRQT